MSGGPSCSVKRSSGPGKCVERSGLSCLSTREAIRRTAWPAQLRLKMQSKPCSCWKSESHLPTGLGAAEAPMRLVYQSSRKHVSRNQASRLVDGVRLDKPAGLICKLSDAVALVRTNGFGEKSGLACRPGPNRKHMSMDTDWSQCQSASILSRRSYRSLKPEGMANRAAVPYSPL